MYILFYSFKNIILRTSKEIHGAKMIKNSASVGLRTVGLAMCSAGDSYQCGR